MKPYMYTFVNTGAGMSTGKCIAQGQHAACEALELSDLKIKAAWNLGKHTTKVVLEAQDEQHLQTIQAYIEARGFRTYLVIDEGRTEIRPHTATALGVEIVDKDDDHVKATFEAFKKFPASYGQPPIRSKEQVIADAYLTVGYGHLNRKGRKAAEKASGLTWIREA